MSDCGDRCARLLQGLTCSVADLLQDGVEGFGGIAGCQPQGRQIGDCEGVAGLEHGGGGVVGCPASASVATALGGLGVDGEVCRYVGGIPTDSL